MWLISTSSHLLLWLICHFLSLDASSCWMQLVLLLHHIQSNVLQWNNSFATFSSSIIPLILPNSFCCSISVDNATCFAASSCLMTLPLPPFSTSSCLMWCLIHFLSFATSSFIQSSSFAIYSHSTMHLICHPLIWWCDLLVASSHSTTQLIYCFLSFDNVTPSSAQGP